MKTRNSFVSNSSSTSFVVEKDAYIRAKESGLSFTDLKYKDVSLYSYLQYGMMYPWPMDAVQNQNYSHERLISAYVQMEDNDYIQNVCKGYINISAYPKYCKNEIIKIIDCNNKIVNYKKQNNLKYVYTKDCPDLFKDLYNAKCSFIGKAIELFKSKVEDFSLIEFSGDDHVSIGIGLNEEIEYDNYYSKILKFNPRFFYRENCH